MDTDTSWLTLTEIARRLGHPPSTVASRRTAYRDHLESRADERGATRYRLDAFAEMDRLMARNAGGAEIRRVLDVLRESDQAEPVEPFETAVLARLDAILAAVERIAARLDAAAEEP